MHTHAHRYIGTQVHRQTGTQVHTHRYTGTQVQIMGGTGMGESARSGALHTSVESGIGPRLHNPKPAARHKSRHQFKPNPNVTLNVALHTSSGSATALASVGKTSSK